MTNGHLSGYFLESHVLEFYELRAAGLERRVTMHGGGGVAADVATCIVTLLVIWFVSHCWHFAAGMKKSLTTCTSEVSAAPNKVQTVNKQRDLSRKISRARYLLIRFVTARVAAISDDACQWSDVARARDLQ